MKKNKEKKKEQNQSMFFSITIKRACECMVLVSQKLLNSLVMGNRWKIRQKNSQLMLDWIEFL